MHRHMSATRIIRVQFNTLLSSLLRRKSRWNPSGWIFNMVILLVVEPSSWKNMRLKLDHATQHFGEIIIRVTVNSWNHYLFVLDMWFSSSEAPSPLVSEWPGRIASNHSTQPTGNHLHQLLRLPLKLHKKKLQATPSAAFSVHCSPSFI